MPSVTHQWLLLWIARKMTADGLIVGGYDGPTPQGGYWNKLSRPFEIAGLRPDTWAFDPRTDELAIGEAKTADDLANAHTLRQIRVFGGLMQRTPRQLCRMYIAVPRSATCFLDRLLARATLPSGGRVVRLHIPDCMVEQDSHEHA